MTRPYATLAIARPIRPVILLANEAGSFIHGSVLTVDGALDALVA